MLNVFESQTSISSYWAGFIAADGCIYVSKNGRKSLEFCLSEKDKNHIEKFTKLINFTGTIKHWTNNIGSKSIKVKIFDKNICDSLGENFLIFPRKTFSLVAPKLSVDNERHYIRGLYDGDGSLKHINGKMSYVDIDFNGLENILQFIRNHLHVNCGAPLNSIFKSGSIFRLSYRNTTAAKVLNYLKKDTNLFLERKAFI